MRIIHGMYTYKSGQLYIARQSKTDVREVAQTPRVNVYVLYMDTLCPDSATPSRARPSERERSASATAGFLAGYCDRGRIHAGAHARKRASAPASHSSACMHFHATRSYVVYSLAA